MSDQATFDTTIDVDIIPQPNGGAQLWCRWPNGAGLLVVVGPDVPAEATQAALQACIDVLGDCPTLPLPQLAQVLHQLNTPRVEH